MYPFCTIGARRGVLAEPLHAGIHNIFGAGTKTEHTSLNWDLKAEPREDHEESLAGKSVGCCSRVDRQVLRAGQIGRPSRAPFVSRPLVRWRERRPRGLSAERARDVEQVRAREMMYIPRDNTMLLHGYQYKPGVVVVKYTCRGPGRDGGERRACGCVVLYK